MKVSKEQLKRLILKEIAMIRLSPMNQIHSDESCGCDEQDEIEYSNNHNSEMMTAPRGMMSKEACCTAIEAIAQCCECPETRAIILEMCNQLR